MRRTHEGHGRRTAVAPGPTAARYLHYGRITLGAADAAEESANNDHETVQAGRIMAGVTFSTPGNWTSWPPHEHSKLLEEAYLFIDMPSPSFGVQFVYTDRGERRGT